MNGQVDKQIPLGIQCCVCLEPPQQLVVTEPQQHHTPNFSTLEHSSLPPLFVSSEGENFAA